MSHAEVSSSVAGLDIGTRRFLHPGPLRWLRSLGWGGLLFVLFAVLYGVLDIVAQLDPNTPPVARNTLITVGVTVVSLALYAGLVRLAEKRWPGELALKPAAPDLLVGVAVGVGMMTVVVGALVAFGLYDISGPRPASPLNMLNIAIASGFLEELIFRAIVLRLLMRAFGIWPALAFSAALFGVLHLENPNATPVAAAAIAVEAGLMLASFYLLTGRLWVSIGVHAAWNFAQGWIFGARVSGIEMAQSLFVSGPKAEAPDWLSGGAFGPEASVPAMVVGTGVAVLVLHRAWKKGNFKAAPDAA